MFPRWLQLMNAVFLAELLAVICWMSWFWGWNRWNLKFDHGELPAGWYRFGKMYLGPCPLIEIQRCRSSKNWLRKRFNSWVTWHRDRLAPKKIVLSSWKISTIRIYLFDRRDDNPGPSILSGPDVSQLMEVGCQGVKGCQVKISPNDPIVTICYYAVDHFILGFHHVSPENVELSGFWRTSQPSRHGWWRRSSQRWWLVKIRFPKCPLFLPGWFAKKSGWLHGCLLEII